MTRDDPAAEAHGRGPEVLTVLGPVPAADLGVTDAHDHLFLRSPALAGQEFDDLDRSVAEVREAQATGLHAIVEMTPIGCGRRPDLLRALAIETGAVVVAATGYHRDAHYPAGHWVYDAPVATLAVVVALTTAAFLFSASSAVARSVGAGAAVQGFQNWLLARDARKEK